jgi:hypothetical protein
MIGSVSDDDSSAGVNDSDDEMRTHFEAVGRVTVASAWLEEQLRSVYIAMLDSPVVAPYVAAGQTFGTMHAACLVIQRETQWQHDPATFDRVMQDAKALYEQRNEIVHGTWVSISGEMTASRSRQWRLSNVVHTWGVEDMHRLADEIEAHSEAMRAMIATGHHWPRP